MEPYKNARAIRQIFSVCKRALLYNRVTEKSRLLSHLLLYASLIAAALLVWAGALNMGGVYAEVAGWKCKR